MTYQCNYCCNVFSTKSILNNHQKNASYCLEKRKIILDQKFICDICDKSFSLKDSFNKHYNTCSNHIGVIKLKKIIKTLEDENNQLKIIQVHTNEYKQQIKELQNKLENIAVNAVNHTYIDQNVIEIEREDIDNNKQSEEKYTLEALEVGNGYVIENREKDGFINVTNLCKAGDKQFKHWKANERTKAFLKVLSEQVGIPTSTLISIEQTSNTNKTTWVHPQVAINIAQWISPLFDVKVSAWVYEVMITGKIDISNTKSFRQLQSENKDHKLRIKYLSNKILKKQSRIQYKEKNVIYILTTASLKKENRYILGKATDLTNRLSTYNKTDEHEVIYYKECKNEETMGLVEGMVFNMLDNEREQANRERFILTDGKDIKYFTDIIHKCVEFFKVG